MACTGNTKEFFLKWYKEVFGFSDEVVRALYDDQLLKNKATLAKLGDQDIDNIIRAIRRTLPIAEISAARLKLAIF